MIAFDQYWLTVTLAVFMPMVVALVTKQQAAQGVKALLLLFLSAVTGTLTQIQADGGTFAWKTALVGTTIAFLTSVGVHFGLLKPLVITGSDGVIQSSIPKGLG